jgi:hypothetical protein
VFILNKKSDTIATVETITEPKLKRNL